MSGFSFYVQSDWSGLSMVKLIQIALKTVEHRSKIEQKWINEDWMDKRHTESVSPTASNTLRLIVELKCKMLQQNYKRDSL